MGSRDFYKATYRNENSNGLLDSHHDLLDNDTECNANQFKLYDDFTTDMRIVNFATLRSHNMFREMNDRRDEGPRFGGRRSRSGVANDSGVDMENGNSLEDALATNDSDLLENEVMVDPWSSMESTNSPDSAPSVSEDCTPSTSSEIAHGSIDAASPLSPDLRDHRESSKTKIIGPHHARNKIAPSKIASKPRSRDLTLNLETLDTDPVLPQRSHFLDDDYQSPSRSNIECRILKPHFLDHSPSPDEFDERGDITNPHFLDDDAVEGDDLQNVQKKAGALPKRPQKVPSSDLTAQDVRPHKTNYRSTLHYGLESAARSSERDKRASQLYRGTWPGEREAWTAHDTSSVRSYSSNGSAEASRSSSNLENKMECVYSLLSLLTLSPDNNADLSGPLLEMSCSVESCNAMRQAGCIPLLVQLIHSKVPRETRDRAAKALRNIIHTQKDGKAGRREARVWRLLEQVREYCYILEDLVEARKEGKELIEDDGSKHPSQCVAALMKLSFDEEHRHVVCQLGGLQTLAALVSGDQAAHGSGTDDSTCLTMRRYAGMTLTNLTFGDGNNKSLLCSFKEFMLALVEQLDSPNDDTRQVTAAVLRNLSWRADTNGKQVLREVGAVKGLTKAAMTCQKEATLKSLLSALWNLTAHCSMNKVALCSVEGALGFLVDMLSYDSPTKTLAVVENAGGIMRNVSSHIAVREDYRQILRERNCLSVLLQHLQSPSLTVVSNSCGTLWNLSARCPQDQQFLWDHGAVPMLRSLIHSKHKMIAMGTSAALKNLINSKPGKSQIIGLDSTARNMNLPALPTLDVRKQKALEQELDQNIAETYDNIEPATSPATSNREEKNLFTATERQMALNLERHRMTSSSPLMGTLASQISLSHSAHLASYLSCSNTLLKGGPSSRAASDVNRSDSKDSVTSVHSDSTYERVARTGKVPIPTPRSKDLVKADSPREAFDASSRPQDRGRTRPVPPPRTSAELRTNYAESGYDVDQDSCDQPIDYSRKYSDTKPAPAAEPSGKYPKKGAYGDYQETDLDQPTDYSLRYAEHQSEPAPSVHEDTIKHFCTEGTPYETPVIFSTATSMSDLRVIGTKDRAKTVPAKENLETMTHSDEKDTCSVEEPSSHDNDQPPAPTQFDTKFSSGVGSPEKPVNYCEEGTPGYFSRVSSLSSLGEPTEEDCLAKRNAMATINSDVNLVYDDNVSSSAKDKEGCKAVTFARDPEPEPEAELEPAFVEDTPLMFSRTSSLGSLPDCDNNHDDHASVVSEISRLTSGCISPSEIPDSPNHSAPPSPRPAPLSCSTPSTPPTPPPESGSVFEERVSQFVVENTPAHFSTATSLSELTIPDDNKPLQDEGASVASEPAMFPGDDDGSNIDPTENGEASNSDIAKECCRVYVTEDTPAALSKAGSRSDLSALSALSDSGCSDADELLQRYIQRGLDVVVKNKGQSSESEAAPFVWEYPYRSLPPYLRSSTETVKLSQEAALSRNLRDSSVSSSSPPPPLPPKSCSAVAPPRPPHYGRKHESRLPVKTQKVHKDKPKLPNTNDLALNDSLSSLSLDSFGSTDREIFEETVKAGLSSVTPRGNSAATGEPQDKSHSVERHSETARSVSRHHKSLDRSDKITQHKPKFRDLDFEKSLASGTYNNLKATAKTKKQDADAVITRSPYSYHGDTAAQSLAHHSRRHGERSGSLSSLSNDSFGSTDKEVFERCVRVGMAKGEGEEGARRGRSEERVEGGGRARRRRARGGGALERMVGDQYSRDRAILEEVIARGAGEKRDDGIQSKNVPAPSAGRASADGNADRVQRSGCDERLVTGGEEVTRSNERLATGGGDVTLESDVPDELDRSNESYADVLDGSWSDAEHPTGPKAASNRTTDPEIRVDEDVEGILLSRRSVDTWNDNTCPDDVTFPTVSGSVHMAASDPSIALPDLLEKSLPPTMSVNPDLTDKLDNDHSSVSCIVSAADEERDTDPLLLDAIPEPSFVSLLEETEPKFDSFLSSAIAKEAAVLAAQLKVNHYAMENSTTSLTSLDLDNVRPPSNLGSLLSLSASGQWDESSNQKSKKTFQKSRKKSLPIALMVKRALSNSLHRGSSEHLDSNPISFLDNVKPPSEMENIDMESSMVSVASIASEVVEVREKTPIVFDLNQPVQEFPLCNNFQTNVFHDLDKVNPPSLFDEMAESTVEMEQTTAHEVFDDCISNTLNVVTDIPSGSEHCTPLPSDVSSAESTPKKNRNSKYLSPKEKRLVSKDRYQTYTINDSVSENDVVLEVDSEEFLTWTKSESDSRSDDYVTATAEPKLKKKLSAKQRRQEDRARYQTQTVNISSILNQDTQVLDPQLELLKQRFAAKKSMKQRRLEDAERFRTRTLSEDMPPSPTYVTKDANFENVESTTGYDSLSSNELNQQLLDDRARQFDVFSRDADSGHNDDDFELNSTQLQSYTKSFRNYLPVVESPAAVDLCVVKNLRNIELTASFRHNAEQNPSTSDFASYEGDSDRDDKMCNSDSESESPVLKHKPNQSQAKPKIIKPESRRDESLDSNDSLENEQSPKAIRGRKKPMYVSPYRRNAPTTKKPTGVLATKNIVANAQIAPKTTRIAVKSQTGIKAPTKQHTFPKANSANTSPKKTLTNKSSPSKLQRPVTTPLVSSKPLPITRQGTFTKEDSVVPAKDLPAPDKNSIPARKPKTFSSIPTTSPSRLPQPNTSKFSASKSSVNVNANAVSANVKNEARPQIRRASKPSTMKTSTSNHSLQSNDSVKTVASRGTASAGSAPAKTKDVESKIASLWRKVEQSKNQPSKPDKRVWISSERGDKPKLIRSSTFDGPPATTSVPSATATRATMIPGYGGRRGTGRGRGVARQAT